MAVMNVNPTRMELTNLKRKLSTARRGHKLLKDKRDELMRRFLDLVKENKALRIRVEEGIKQANVNMEIARSAMNDKSLSVAMMLPTQEMSLESSEKNVMSVMIPVFDVQYKTADKNDIYSYGTAFTSAELDISMKLDENERSTTTRLMKVKDMMLEQAHHYDDPFGMEA